MSMEVALTQLKIELDDAAALLLDLQRDAHVFAKEDDYNLEKKSIKNTGSRLNRTAPVVAGSSWSKSKSSRNPFSIFSNNIEGQVYNNTDCVDLIKSERWSKTNAPAYSFPRGKHIDRKRITSASSTLYPKVDFESKRRKQPGVRIMKPSYTQVAAEESPPAIGIIVESETIQFKTCKGFSFGKEPKSQQIKVSTIDAAPLDVITVLDAVRPRTPMAIIRKPSEPRKSTGAIADEQQSQLHPTPELSRLSYRPRAPSVTMKESASRSRIPLNEQSPGPCSYTIHSTFAAQSDGGKIYFDSSRLNPKARDLLSGARDAGPGPGYYDTSAADKVTKQQSRSNVDMSKAEMKELPPHLAAKRYWEEKARDAREEHDDQRVASLHAIRPKTPCAIITSNSSVKKPSTSATIIDEINTALKISESNKGEGSVSYEVKYSQVERSVRAAVNMAKEVAVLQSLDECARKRPALQEARAKLVAAHEPRVYGPQVHIPWAEDKLPPRRKMENDFDAEIDIKELFPSDESKHDIDEEFAEAYLKSNLLGLKRGAVKFENFEKKKDKIDNGGPSNFIGPQNIIDWHQKFEIMDSNHKLNSLSMDLSRGRDSIRVDGKKKRVIAFDDLDEKDSHLGPGMYSKTVQFGSSAKGVPFSKFSYLNDYEYNLDNDDELYLDVETASNYLRKNRPRDITLYARDRFEMIDRVSDEEVDIDGRGCMEFAEASSQKTTVAYSTMRGRDENLEADLNEEELSISVQNWKPQCNRIPSYTFGEPSKNSRFSKEGEKDYALIIEPDHSAISRKHVLMVDMTKQLNRDSSPDHKRREDIDREIALEIVEERQRNMTNAVERKFKNIVPVDMSKQIGRSNQKGNFDERALDLAVDRAVVERRVTGGVNMDKKISRSPMNNCSLEEELILSPKIQSTHRYRQTSTGSKWNIEMERFKLNDKFEEELIIDDVDPTTFKKGFKVVSNLDMSKQSYRLKNKLIIGEKIRMETGEKEEADLSRRFASSSQVQRCPKVSSFRNSINLLSNGNELSSSALILDDTDPSIFSKGFHTRSIVPLESQVDRSSSSFLEGRSKDYERREVLTSESRPFKPSIKQRNTSTTRSLRDSRERESMEKTFSNMHIENSFPHLETPDLTVLAPLHEIKLPPSSPSCESLQSSSLHVNTPAILNPPLIFSLLPERSDQYPHDVRKIRMETGEKEEADLSRRFASSSQVQRCPKVSSFRNSINLLSNGNELSSSALRRL